MSLTPTEHVNGIFSVIVVIIYMVLGILIILKYRKIKNTLFIYWGIGLLGVGLPYMGSGISYLMIISIGTGLTAQSYLFVGTTWMAITLFFWMWTMTELMYKEKQKIILGIYAVIGGLYEIYFIYWLMTDPSVIAQIATPPLDLTYVGLTALFLLFVIASIWGSLIIFCVKSLKSESAEIRLKAKILLLAIIPHAIATFGDGLFPLTIVTITIFRLFMIIGGLLYYIGWVMPEPIKNVFLK